MDKREFKLFLKKYFNERGFEKIKSKFYRNGNGFLCEIDIGKSYYGEIYYFDYSFYIEDFQKPYAVNRESAETYPPYVGGRFYFTETDGYSCAYLTYEQERLTTILDENMNIRIYPPFETGKNYLLDHFGSLYSTFLNKDKIKQLLSE